mgnify:CR=1 FL=1
MKLENKVAIVTGASRGIGKAIALALAEERANVVVVARSETEGRLPGTIHKTVEEIRALGGNALAVKTDVTKEDEVNEMVQKTLDYYGRINVLVNNTGLGHQSGVGLPTTFMEISIEMWDLVVAVNLRSAFLCSKAVLPFMVKQRSGSIINVSSVMTYTPSGVTKAAIDRLTAALAREVKEYNIAVNALCPDYTLTESFKVLSHDMGRSQWQKPEMWGRYAAFLACQDASSLTGKYLIAEELEKLISESVQKAP